MTPEWKTATNHRTIKRQARLRAKRVERAKWSSILNEYPHIVPPNRAKRLCEILRIDKLDEKLMSDEWVDFQKKGWVYVKTLKVQKEEPVPESKDYAILNIDNGWGDKVLFEKLHKHEQKG